MGSEPIPRGLATGLASEYNYIIKIPYIKIPCGLAAGSLQYGYTWVKRLAAALSTSHSSLPCAGLI